MSAWDFPFFIVATFVVAMGLGLGLMRLASLKSRTLPFACAVCGRDERAPSAKQWRYCPYCGAPKDARGLRDLPKQEGWRRHLGDE